MRTFGLGLQLGMGNVVTRSQGGGGGKVGLDPSEIAGLTYWVNGTDPATLFTDDGTIPVVSNGDLVYAALSGGPDTFAARRFRQATLAQRPTYLTNAVNGKSALDFSTAGTKMTSLLGSSSFYSSVARSLVFAAYLPASTTTSATGWYNKAVIADTGAFAISTGVFFKNDAGTQRVLAYNYDGAADIATNTFPSNTWAVVAVRHNVSGIQVRVNRGSWATTASGTNVSLTATLNLAYNTFVTEHYPTKIAHLATYNVSISDGDLEQLEDFMANEIGVSLP